MTKRGWTGLGMIIALFLVVVVGIFIQSPKDGLLFLVAMGVLAYIIAALGLIISD